MPDDRLYNLLPEYYRAADTAAGSVLRELLQVISAQVDVVQADLDQLYRNWFIETCQDWVVPYLGDLVGYQPLSMGEAAQSTTAEGQRLERAVEGRADVGRTVATRLRKGTPAVLVELAADVARWPARAVEFRTLLEATQSVNHVRLDRGRTADLRNGDQLDNAGGPFDRLAHVAEIARASSARRAGRYDIPDLGLFVWRLGCYSITRAPAFCWDQSRNQYSFNILGIDASLLTSPQDPGRLTEPDEVDVPAWIRRRWFKANLDDYYGPHASLCVWRDQPDDTGLVPVTDIVPADLTDWTYRARRGQVAIDPVLGRIAFPPGNAPSEGVWVSYHYGFSADLGGGEYLRLRPAIAGRQIYQVRTGGDPDAGIYATIMAAVARWRTDKTADGSLQDAVIEVLDSGVYAETMDIALDEGDHLELRAAPGTRPVILLQDRYANRPDAMRVYGTGQPNGKAAAGPAAAAAPPLPGVDPGTGCLDYPIPPMPTFVLDGFLVTGRSLLVTGPVARVTIRHCTLVPGWSLECDCTARRGEEPSVELTSTPAKLVVDHSIIGSIQVTLDQPVGDPIQIDAHDSIIDATSTTLPAIASTEGGYAYATVRLRRCTVIGAVLAHVLALGENTIFLGLLQVARRQQGCARFCWIEPGSRTPSRYECQPDLVRQAISAAAAAPHSTLAASQVSADQDAETARVRPRFNSLGYGSPVYCQLAQDCAPEITSGADDESELGAFHDLFQPQRLANLTDRLQDFTPADMNSAVFIVT
jgi:hypothetical protein